MNFKLKEGQVVYFKSDSLPYNLIARSERYAVCTRELDLEEDKPLLEFEVTRGAYASVEAAYNALKGDLVYSILDFLQLERGPHNIIFNAYDFRNPADCKKLIEALKKGECEISRRNHCNLDIDWDKTKV